MAKIIGRDRLVGLSVVLIFHAAVIYGLWRYGFIPTSDETVTLVVNFINPSVPDQAKSPPPKPVKLRPIAPFTPQQLVVQAPVVSPDEPVAAPLQPVMVAPPATPQPPVTGLSEPEVRENELAVMCDVRTFANYPLASKRLNEQGKTLLLVELDDDGKVSRATVNTSSGYARLDEAALVAIKTWRCKPASKKTIRSGLIKFSFGLGQ